MCSAAVFTLRMSDRAKVLPNCASTMVFLIEINEMRTA